MRDTPFTGAILEAVDVATAEGLEDELSIAAQLVPRQHVTFDEGRGVAKLDRHLLHRVLGCERVCIQRLHDEPGKRLAAAFIDAVIVGRIRPVHVADQRFVAAVDTAAVLRQHAMDRGLVEQSPHLVHRSPP